VSSFWLIPLLPFVGAIVNGLFGRRLGMKGTSTVAMLTTFGAFALTAIAFVDLLGLPAGQRTVEHTLFTWIAIGGVHAEIGFLLDPLSAVMIGFVTGVGFLIHVYSRGYMEHDPGAWRYFAYLNLFMGSMLTLVLGNNLLLMFLGWEGVGLCSYLLIGFWYERRSATDAGKKAFVVNRIGDFGFLLGMLLIFAHFGTLNLVEISENASHVLVAGGGVATAIGLLLFVGATGKSAQLPLYTWLPDAMEGPTPVSALIHAATMVTAGVYMVARMSPIYVLAPDALFWVAVIGCLTAIFAATIGMAQDDIKRVLAYSTVSQLGYMFLACGVGAFGAGIFHVMTHAFFKALLFLGSGAVIHALHEEQNIWKMGALRDKLPTTHRTFLVACLAIAGIPPLAGFFSKDEILWKTFASGNVTLYVLGLVTAGITAFYMFRLLFVTFYGKSRVASDTLAHIHRPSAWMRVPLIVLAVLAVLGGLVGVPILEGGNRIGPFLAESLAEMPAATDHSDAAYGEGDRILAAMVPAAGAAEAEEATAADPHATDASAGTTRGDTDGEDVLAAGSAHAGDHADAHGEAAHAEHHDVGLELLLMGLSVLVALAGILLARQLYLARPGSAESVRRSAVGRLVAGKYFVDELYDALWVRPTHRLATFLWQGFDVIVIDGLVNGSGRLFRGLSDGVRRTQNGQAQGYLVSIMAGSAALLVYLVLR
jgi:NADH-quinone oxidoreductase subunit L